MTPHPTQIEPLKRLMKIVNSFLSRPDIGPFREPVDWRGLGLDDYPKIVKKMMDLGSVKRKLERKQYYTATECADDIRLIWSNCMAYNADGSDFWLLAKSFARRFEDRYRKIRQEMDCGADLRTGDDKSPEGAPSSSSKSKESKQSASSSAVDDNHYVSIPESSPSKPLPLDARARFGTNLFLLSGVELAHVILQLERECPEALEHLKETASEEDGRCLDPPRLEINVDALPTLLFEELSKYVEARVGTKGPTDSNKNMMDSGSGDNNPRPKKKKKT